MTLDNPVLVLAVVLLVHCEVGVSWIHDTSSLCIIGLVQTSVKNGNLQGSSIKSH